MIRPAATPTPKPTVISRRNSQTTSVTEASGTVASSIIPIIKAMPTGSLNPDSPSRIVPVRPSTSLPASTENVTAGIGGGERGPDQQRDGPVESEQDVGGDRDERRCAEGAEDAHDRDRQRCRPEPPQPDPHASVEEDRDQRHGRDALNVLEREQVREPVGDLGRDSGDDEEEGGRRNADPGGRDAHDDRERQPAGDDEDLASEVDDVCHRPDSPFRGRRLRAGARRRRLQIPYRRLTRASFRRPILSNVCASPH